MGLYPGTDVWPNTSLWPEEGGEVAPTVVTGAPSGLTTTSATLNGTVDPEGLQTRYYFEWGVTVGYGFRTPEVIVGSGTSPVSVSAEIAVESGTLYHYRIVAFSAAGTSYGADVSFYPYPLEPEPEIAEPDVRLSGLAESHQLVVEAILLPTEGDEVTLPGLQGGSVTLDAGAATRGQCDLTFVDDGTLGLLPTDVDSWLVPYGNEIQVRRGIRQADGSEQTVSLGVFRIQDVDVSDQATGQEIRVTGFDRSMRIIDAKFETPYTSASGTDYLTALLAVVQGGWEDVPYSFPDYTASANLLIAEEGEDRWAFAQAMASFIGMDLYFDRDGVLTLAPVPSILTTDPVAQLSEGEGGLLLSADAAWSREASFNKVIYTGESTDVDGAVPRGEALDDNVKSPTYYYGDFGRVPIWANSSFIVDSDQAQTAAQGKLNRELGTSRSVNFGSLVDPLLQPNDVVWITRERTNIDEAHIIDQLTIPLGATESMSGRTRSVLAHQ